MMKRIIYIILLFLLFACKQEPPYWKTDSFGFISSLAEGDTLKIKGGDYYDSSFDYLRIFIKGDSLYALYELLDTYRDKTLQRKDTLLLWKNAPLNISNNKLVLDWYKKFEQEFKVWQDTLDLCSPYSKYSIYFNRDTLTIVDRSCGFKSHGALTYFIRESVKPEDIYFLPPLQADSIRYYQNQ